MFTKRYRCILILLLILIFPDNPASARRVKGITSFAKILSENESGKLSRQVAQELGLKKLTSPSLSLALVLQEANSFSFGKNWYGYENWAEGEKVKFIRLGYLFFIDEAMYSKLSPQLKNDLGNNAIVVKNLSSNILTNFKGQAYYTLTTIAAMLNSDLSGKRIIDCGAGEGILSLVASKLGAKFLDLIETSGIEITKAKVNLKLNGLKENRDFNLICKNLNNIDKVANQLSKTDLETVVISNIGTWPGSYPGVSNQTSMQLLQLIPNAAIFIAGGYNTLLNNNAIRQDKKAICSRGFKIQKDEAEFGNIGKFVAWIAIKK